MKSAFDMTGPEARAALKAEFGIATNSQNKAFLQRKLQALRNGGGDTTRLRKPTGIPKARSTKRPAAPSPRRPRQQAAKKTRTARGIAAVNAVLAQPGAKEALVAALAANGRGPLRPTLQRPDGAHRQLVEVTDALTRAGVPAGQVARVLTNLADLGYEIRGKRARPIRERVPSKNDRLLPKSGVITKVFKGVTHTVHVKKDAFVWNGESYGGLSTIAGRICGNAINGWVFFGLKPSPQKGA